MPENATPVKVEAVRAYGATVHFCAPTQQAREEGLARLRPTVVPLARAEGLTAHAESIEVRLR